MFKGMRGVREVNHVQGDGRGMRGVSHVQGDKGSEGGCHVQGEGVRGVSHVQGDRRCICMFMVMGGVLAMFKVMGGRGNFNK